MFSSSKISMSARPTGRYQIGLPIVGPGMFGNFSMNADGSVLAVSFYDGTNRVAVYNWTGSSWERKGFSDIILAERGDGVPGVGVERVSLSLDAGGTTLAVGTPTGLGVVDGQSYGMGRVYVYYWDGSSWVQKGSEILNPTASEPVGQEGNVSFGFGDHVSLSRDGSRLAVGAMDESSGSPVPFVAIYDWVPPVDGGANGPYLPGTFTLNTIIGGGRFTNLDWSSFGGAFSDKTGRSVKLSSDGDAVAWGVLRQDGSGAATFQTLPCSSCGPGVVALLSEQSPPSNSSTDNPQLVSLSGDGRTVAVCDGPYMSGMDSIPSSTRVYRLTGQSEEWIRIGSDISFAGRAALSHDGNTIATSEGYVYRFDGSAWSSVRIELDPVLVHDHCAVSYDGTVVALGRQESADYVLRVYRWN